MQNEIDSNIHESAGAGSKNDKSLGDPIREFRSKMTTRLIVATCGLILLGGGVWLIVAMGPLGPGPWVLPFSIVLFGLAYFMGKASHLVCSEGIIQVRFGRRQYCRWDELGEIIDVQIKQGIVSSRRCELLKKNGSRMELTNLGISNFAEMVDLIRKQAQSRGIPWKEECQKVQ